MAFEQMLEDQNQKEIAFGQMLLNSSSFAGEEETKKGICNASTA